MNATLLLNVMQEVRVCVCLREATTTTTTGKWRAWRDVESVVTFCMGCGSALCMHGWLCASALTPLWWSRVLTDLCDSVGRCHRATSNNIVFLPKMDALLLHSGRIQPSKCRPVSSASVTVWNHGLWCEEPTTTMRCIHSRWMGARQAFSWFGSSSWHSLQDW